MKVIVTNCSEIVAISYFKAIRFQKLPIVLLQKVNYLITRNYGITDLRLQFFYVSFIKVKIKALHLN